MSTILDALKKVERERESTSDRLRHEPTPEGPRARRVSTVTIVVCAILGFGAGAGIALWRNADPLPEQPPAAVAAAPRIDVPADSPPAKRVDPPSRVDGRLAVAPQPEIDEDSALEPSPFAPPPAESARPKVATAPRPAVRPAPPSIVREPAIGATRPPAFGAPAEEPALETAPAAMPFPDDSVDDFGAALPGEVDELDAGEVESEDALQSDPETTVIDTGRSPPGAPQVTLSFLQWSADPARRFAFVSIDGGPSQRVREGDAAGGASIDRITADGIHVRHAETVFVIRPRH